VFFNISNWSRGADAIVVNKHINTVADLKGKTIATSEATASHTLLLNVLETNGIRGDEVNINIVPSGVEAAQVFKAKQSDAAVVYSPDDEDLVNEGLGKVLISTKQASSIICSC
jgi:NitT/TauT family transport system substrate-binding protein